MARNLIVTAQNLAQMILQISTQHPWTSAKYLRRKEQKQSVSQTKSKAIPQDPAERVNGTIPKVAVVGLASITRRRATAARAVGAVARKAKERAKERLIAAQGKSASSVGKPQKQELKRCLLQALHCRQT